MDDGSACSRVSHVPIHDTRLVLHSQACQVSYMEWETPAFWPFILLSHQCNWFFCIKQKKIFKKHLSSSSGCSDIKVQDCEYVLRFVNKNEINHLQTCDILTFWEKNITWILLDDNSKFSFHCSFVWHWKRLEFTWNLSPVDSSAFNLHTTLIIENLHILWP